MTNPFVAEIRIFPFDFAPTGWAFCNGQLLPLSQNTALFSLLGTTYGGDGKSNFALPNMQGNAPMFWGQGPGLSLYDLGQSGGSSTVTVTVAELPAHAHGMTCQTQFEADKSIPASNEVFSRSKGGTLYQSAATSGLTMGTSTIAPTGGTTPHSNLMPYLTLNFCIALQGVYPART